MNKHVLVVNNIATPLKKINENAANGKSSPMIMSGTFTELDVLNRNGRIYTPDNFLPLVAEMQDRIANGAVYGEMDHPDVFDITFQKTSHIIEKIEYNKEKNIVEGQIRLLSTYWGREAQAIVNDGCPIFVSSRAAGITDSNGYVTLKKLFTYDIVADPGFATAKMNPACLNEALGINENANYAIFELNTENQIQSLYNMNNDDKKTHSQLAEYSAYVDEQIASLKEEISRLTRSSNNEKSILEKAGELESLKQQNEVLERYLNKLSTKVVSLISKVNDLSSTNEALKEEIQIVGKFAEHVAEHTNEAKKDIEIVGKFAEHVAEHTNEAKKDIEIVGKFAEHVAEHTNEAKKDIEIVGKFAEHVAEHTKSNTDTAKYIKERLEQTVLFAEHIAHESVKTFDEQTRFIEYVAENTHENKVYEAYLKDKLESLINYNIDTAAKLNEAFSNGSINENVITVESPESYLKDEELPEGTEDVEINDTDDIPADDLTIGELETSEESIEEIDDEEDLTKETTGEEPIVTYGDGLVRITGTDLTGIVISYDEDGVTIKLSDSNEEITKPHDEVEKLEEVEDDSTLLESVMNLISEVKKRDTSKTTEPELFKFLNDSQIDAFKGLNRDQQDNVIAAFNESECYTNADAVRLISKTLSKDQLTLNEKLLANIPSNVVSKWDALNESQKTNILNQAKFCTITGSDSIVEFWNTRQFENIEIINEGTKVATLENENESLSEEHVAAFMKAFDKL